MSSLEQRISDYLELDRSQHPNELITRLAIHGFNTNECYTLTITELGQMEKLSIGLCSSSNVVAILRQNAQGSDEREADVSRLFNYYSNPIGYIHDEPLMALFENAEFSFGMGIMDASAFLGNITSRCDTILDYCLDYINNNRTSSAPAVMAGSLIFIPVVMIIDKFEDDMTTRDRENTRYLRLNRHITEVQRRAWVGEMGVRVRILRNELFQQLSYILDYYADLATSVHSTW